MALTDTLISYYPLGEASGDALDAHGSNDLTENNTVGSASGKVGNARDFEASNSEYFNHADNADLSTGDIDFTITAWVNLETGGTGTQMIVAKDSDTLGREFILSYSDGGASQQFGFVVLKFGSPGQVVASNFGTPSTGTWYFIVAWHDATNNQLGISVNDGTPNTASWSSGVDDTGAPFRIGARAYSGFENYFDGLIDEVGFWKRVLTSAEITELYNGGSGLAYPFTGGATVNRRRRVLLTRAA